jgi:hypothetical protein
MEFPRQMSIMVRERCPRQMSIMVSLPPLYRVLDFTKFSDSDNVSTIEHVSQYLTQCGEISTHDPSTTTLFALLLSGSAFNWFTSLLPNSINVWADLEKKFHKYFYTGMSELKLTDLTSVRQQTGDYVSSYIQRFRGTSSRCFRLSLSDQ